jgi:2-desacetyl-2-hydroxyethyl bacteriochlorophyllide A dehydrogenase
MKEKGSVLVISGPKAIAFQPFEHVDLEPDQVRLRTLYSGISAGTELTAYRGTNVYTRKKWDAARRLFLPSLEPSMRYPLVGWGYEEVGEIIEVGNAVRQVKVGDVVGGTWGHRTWYVQSEKVAKDRLIPESLDPILGIFTHMGPIALNGILDADLHIGETVAVFGLGVVGQIAARLARLSGAYVIGIDLYEKRLEIAHEIGAVDVGISLGEGSPGEIIKNLTSGRGADVVIEASGSTTALQEAIRAAAYASRVVVLGFIQGGAGSLYLGDEFHHNRIQLTCSQIGGVAPHLSSRWDRIRLIRTILDLQKSEKLNLMPLITHRIPFDQAESAYKLLDETPSEALQVVFEFNSKERNG